MDLIRNAFVERPDLQTRIAEVIAKSPETRSLFENIAQYIAHIQGSTTKTQTLSLNQAEHPSKKRKLETGAPQTIDTWADLQTFADISFSIPQRKKLRLGISPLRQSGLRATNADGGIEFSTKWSEVLEIFCLPVPEKAQGQYNFCVLIKDQEPILWTVPAAAPKDGTMDPAPSQPADATYREHILSLANKALGKRRVIEPTENEFCSQIVQAHRKGEKAYHVKAFRGAKDGFLFFLSTGIFWGFKKPIEFFAFDSIDSVSYTSVLQRTFNLNITARSTPDAEPQEFELSMIDQVDFSGIDEYIKRHRLQDASMAEQRRAKKINVNGNKKEGGEDEDEEEGEGELEKAAREAQDLEDEEEEDDENFDPGSEGESEGEGSASDEDDDEEEANGEDADDDDD